MLKFDAYLRCQWEYLQWFIMCKPLYSWRNFICCWDAFIQASCISSYHLWNLLTRYAPPEKDQDPKQIVGIANENSYYEPSMNQPSLSEAKKNDSLIKKSYKEALT